MDSISNHSEDQDGDYFSQDSQQFQLEQARRQQMLIDLNLTNQFAKDQTMQIIQQIGVEDKIYQTNKQQKNVTQQDSIKKLRAKNTLEFFERMKFLVWTNILNAIKFAKNRLDNSQSQLPELLSLINVNSIKQFHRLKSKNPFSISIEEFVKLIKLIISSLQYLGTIRYTNNDILWIIGLSLQIGFRKVNFIDFSHLQLEGFYDLKYGKRLKKNKQNKAVEIIKKKIKYSIAEEQSNSQYQNLQSYTFQKASSVPALLEYQKTQKNMKIMKEKFLQSFYQLFCPFERKWIQFNTQTLQTYDIQIIKQNILAGKTIVGFYSTRAIQIEPSAKYLMKVRKLQRIQIKDLTIYYADSLENVQKRRLRLGCATIYRQIIDLGAFEKPNNFGTLYQKLIIQQTQKRQQQLYMIAFPIKKDQMRRSQRYIIPSIIPKYMILDPNAKEIGRQFNQEKVYRKKDLIKVSSKMGWIDYARMVKKGEQPVKSTQNRGGNVTKLYQYSQTEPYQLKVSQNGNFIQDQEYNSIYIPPNFQVPETMAIIPLNIDYVCKKNGIKHCRVVQGFKRAAMKVIPNSIGFIIYKSDEEEVMELYNERMSKLQQKKDIKKQQQISGLWKKLIKCILLNQQISEMYNR